MIYDFLQAEDGGFVLVGYSDYQSPWNSDVLLVKTNAAGMVQWSQKYGGTNEERAYAITQKKDGGYAVVCTTRTGESDIWLMQTDKDGMMVWNQTYGGAGDESVHSVIQTKDGAYVFAGVTDTWGAGGSDLWLVKTPSAQNTNPNIIFGFFLFLVVIFLLGIVIIYQRQNQ